MDWINWIRSLAEAKDFSSSLYTQKNFKADSAYYRVSTRVFFHGGKCGQGIVLADHSYTPSAKINNKYDLHLPCP
jgi:hypothetical protein